MVTFGRDPDIGINVTIYGSKFGANIVISDNSVLGSGIEFGDAVKLGTSNCVEDLTKIPNDYSSESNVAWKANDGAATSEQAENGFTFTYNPNTGLCERFPMQA